MHRKAGLDVGVGWTRHSPSQTSGWCERNGVKVQKTRKSMGEGSGGLDELEWTEVRYVE